ncbi:MAG TPA: dihydrodipicolinate synthase family protein [Pyrinomonadaceae bacterium]|nr:dihydrodipicolinate synthase family protein [Pyrinomonadaceae bacterium]
MRDEIGNRKTSHTQQVVNKLRGVLLPFTTPFGEGGEVDAAALGANIERWNETGVAGYVALGSTGERVHLDERERTEVAEASRARVPRELAFVVGVGEHSTRHTILEARRAAATGADAVLVLTPHFYRGAMSQDALAGHFRRVADDSPVPVILYNIPQNTGVAIAPEWVARLSEHANIAGIKDSSGDMVNLVEMIRQVGGGREDFALMTGHAGVFYASLCAGVVGAILAAGCAAPRLCVEIYEAFMRGDHARALESQARLAPLARAVTVRFGVGGLKYALDLVGYKGGAVRAPLGEPNEEARAEIAMLLEETENGAALSASTPPAS